MGPNVRLVSEPNYLIRNVSNQFLDLGLHFSTAEHRQPSRPEPELQRQVERLRRRRKPSLRDVGRKKEVDADDAFAGREWKSSSW